MTRTRKRVIVQCNAVASGGDPSELFGRIFYYARLIGGIDSLRCELQPGRLDMWARAGEAERFCLQRMLTDFTDWDVDVRPEGA